MHSRDFTHTSIPRTVSLLAAVTLAIAMAVIPASAQNAVPPTARQAAASPAFASRLSRPATSPAGNKSAIPIGKTHRGPQQTQSIYENGPVNGNTDAWTINQGFGISDSIFIFGNSGTVAGIDFYTWMYPGDVLTSTEVSITSRAFGGTSYFDQTLNFTQSGCVSNSFGFDVCLEHADFNLPLAGGSYWLNLQNASVANGDPVYWDENSGVGCASQGCPSLADESALGTIPSETFSLEGTPFQCIYGQGGDKNDPLEAQNAKQAPPRTPSEQAQSLQVIYNFTGGQDGGSPSGMGLAIDAAGNFYGTTASGGVGYGTVFSLLHRGARWIFTTLYKFKGPANGDGATPQSGVIVGPDGNPYGVTSFGGFTGNDCRSIGCGTVFKLQPPPNVCPNVSCPWTETVLYSFRGYSGNRHNQSCSVQKPLGDSISARMGLLSGGSDGNEPSGTLGFDQAGNIYGTTHAGGLFTCGGCPAYACGVIFELSPSNGGWAESIFYDFQGQEDGALPEYGVVVDRTGSLNLTTGYFTGTVWIGNSPVYDFGYYGSNGAYPSALFPDGAGNYYGSAYAGGGSGCGGCGCGTIFEMQGSSFQLLYRFTGNGDGGGPGGVIKDAAGNLYGTAQGVHNQGAIFKLTPSNGGWTYTDIYDFTGGADGGDPTGLTLDAQGNIWGTTWVGGSHGHGTVFELTP